MSSERYDSITKSLALACAIDLRPVSMVAGKGFKTFCHKLNPDYQVPCRTTVNKHLFILYESCKLELIQLLTGCEISLTTDLWTACNTTPYITLTAHFITPKWEMFSKTLATRPLVGKHTGVHIAECILALQSEFKIQKVTCLVTDNARNMILAAEHGNFMRWGCFSHTLQLAIEDGLKAPNITKALAFARKLVGHFKHSGTASAALKEKQKNDGVEKPLMVVQSVPTRWNSQFFMAQRLLKLRLPIFAVLMDNKVTESKQRQSLDLPDSSWKVLEDITPVLSPLADATEILTKEDSPTLSQVFILLHQLITKNLAQTADDSPTARNLKASIRGSLVKRFQLREGGIPISLASHPMVACFLDPRYKSLRMLEEEERQQVLTYIQGLVPESLPPAEPLVKQESQGSANSIFDCLVGDIEVDLTKPAAIQQECDMYLAEPVRVSEPLQWWRINSDR